MLIVKDGGAVESHSMAHINGNTWEFDNIETKIWNGPLANFSRVTINHLGFRTKKCLGNIEISKLLKILQGCVKPY